MKILHFSIFIHAEVKRRQNKCQQLKAELKKLDGAIPFQAHV